MQNVKNKEKNDPLSKESEFLRVLHHEVGHWLLSRWVGFHPGDIQINLDRNGGQQYELHALESSGVWCGWGSCTTWLYRQVKSIENQGRYLANREAVLLAGAVHEQKYLESLQSGHAGQSLYKGSLALLTRPQASASDDYKTFREIAMMHINLHIGEESPGCLLNDYNKAMNCEGDPFNEAIVKGRNELVVKIMEHREMDAIDKFIQEVVRCVTVLWKKERSNPNNFPIQRALFEDIYLDLNLHKLSYSDSMFHDVVPSISGISRLRDVIDRLADSKF